MNLSDEQIVAVIRDRLALRGIQGIWTELVEAHRNGRPPEGGFKYIRRLLRLLDSQQSDQ